MHVNLKIHPGSGYKIFVEYEEIRPYDTGKAGDGKKPGDC